ETSLLPAAKRSSRLLRVPAFLSFPECVPIHQRTQNHFPGNNRSKKQIGFLPAKHILLPDPACRPGGGYQCHAALIAAITLSYRRPLSCSGERPGELQSGLPVLGAACGPAPVQWPLRCTANRFSSMNADLLH